MDKLYKATGIFGIAVLALTACGDDDAGQETDEDMAGDTGAEGQDPYGAQQQGDSPGEIAGEEGENEASPVPDDDTMDPPPLEEIIDQAWETSEDQDSVTINIQVSAEAMEEGQRAITGEEDADEDETLPDEEGNGEDIQLTIAGDINGDGTTYTQEGGGEYLIFDDGEQYLQTVPTFVEDYRASAEAQGITAEISPEDLEAALAAEGEWIEVTSTHAESIETPAQFMENFREGFGLASGGAEMSDLSAEAEVDTRDGENVWVYTDGALEIVVLADESEPLLMGISVEDGGVQVEFSEWNEADEPEQPEDEAVIFEDELDAIVEPLIQ